MKDYRKEELKTYVIGNILIILMFSGVFEKIFYLPEDLSVGVTDIVSKLLGSALLSSIIYIYVFILDSLVPSKLKDFIVYFPCGRPGDKIFEKVREKRIDPRFTQEDATIKYQETYKELDLIFDKKKKHAFQNSKWYGIYQSIEENPTVALAQKDFLLNRDMCNITVAILILYVLISWISKIYTIKVGALMWLLVEILLTNIAAKGKAKRFALNVIAKDIHSKTDGDDNNSEQKKEDADA